MLWYSQNHNSWRTFFLLGLVYRLRPHDEEDSCYIRKSYVWNHHGWVKNQRIAPCKVIRISEWEKFFYFWNPELRSGNLESCYWNLESRIHVPLLRDPKSSTWIPESTEWNPGSKTYMGRKEEISIMDVQYQICRLAWRLLVKVIFRQDRIKLPAWHSPPFLLIVSSSAPPAPTHRVWDARSITC